MKIDRNQMANRPGDKLPNHATLLQNYWFETREAEIVGIVLAVTGNKFSEPFATWERCVGVVPTATGGVQQIDITYLGHYFLTIEEALEDFNRRVEEKDVDARNEKAMKFRGHEDGKNAASWLVDGNTPDPYRVLDDFIAGIDSGDPEVLDALPHPNVSGEWADDPTWEQICQDETEGYNSGTGEPDLYDTYVRSFHEGVEAGIREMHKNFSTALGLDA